MFVLANIGKTRVALDIGIELTNPAWNFLISHIDACITFLGDQVGWCWDELRSCAGEQQRRRGKPHAVLHCANCSEFEVRLGSVSIDLPFEHPLYVKLTTGDLELAIDDSEAK